MFYQGSLGKKLYPDFQVHESVPICKDLGFTSKKVKENNSVKCSNEPIQKNQELNKQINNKERDDFAEMINDWMIMKMSGYRICEYLVNHESK